MSDDEDATVPLFERLPKQPAPAAARRVRGPTFRPQPPAPRVPREHRARRMSESKQPEHSQPSHSHSQQPRPSKSLASASPSAALPPPDFSISSVVPSSAPSSSAPAPASASSSRPIEKPVFSRLLNSLTRSSGSQARYYDQRGEFNESVFRQQWERRVQSGRDDDIPAAMARSGPRDQDLGEGDEDEIDEDEPQHPQSQPAQANANDSSTTNNNNNANNNSNNEDDEDDDRINRSPDPLYDPHGDEQDEEWMHQKMPASGTDAVLSCPACFTTLCYDCQKHSMYENQYRAMFYENCRPIADELVRPSKGDVDPHAQYFAVRCNECNTEVGAIGEDEVVHFFNVLAQ